MKKASSEPKVKAALRKTYGGQAIWIIVPTSGFNQRRKFVLAMIGDG